MTPILPARVTYVGAMAHFLLLHGACHGGWCWDRISPGLRAADHGVTAPDLPCDDPEAGLRDYAQAAIDALPTDYDDLVIVAHSLAGLTAPLVASQLPTRRIVMLAAIVGAPGASLATLAEEDADRDLPLGEGGIAFNDEGLFRFSESGAMRVLYPDCSPEDAAEAFGKLRYQRSMWTQVADFAAWPETEYVSITCTEDRVVNPAWSDRMARTRLGVEPIHLEGGHSPFLSRPAELTALLLDL
jgi:pimeloyl-ACP methyl ester carboxylesterase